MLQPEASRDKRLKVETNLVMTAGSLGRLMRPKQWIKNGLVFSALIFTGQFFFLREWIPVVETFCTFCLISSSVYIMNDWRDMKQDRVHPTKCLRPLASGQVSKRGAAYLLAVLLLAGLSLAYLNNPHILLVAIGFFSLNVAYSLYLKNKFLLDAFAIAGGFVLRAFAGAVAMGVEVSPWLFILVSLLAIFLALGKRKGEIRRLKGKAVEHKKVLDIYTIPMLDQYLTILASGIITSYVVYGYFAPKGSHMIMLTVTFVVYGLFRYLYLLTHSDRSDNPDELLVSDLPTLVNIGAWVVSIIFILSPLTKSY